MTTYDLEILIRTKKTGDALAQTEKDAERARAALNGLGTSANRFDIEVSAMGAATQASQIGRDRRMSETFSGPPAPWKSSAPRS